MNTFDLRILLLEITLKCNALCEQCGSRCEAGSEEGLKKEEILGLLSDIKENIGTDMMLNVTGGEPLMRKDLFDIMKEASLMGFDWGMVSNGVLVDERAVSLMKNSGLKTITISIDGLEKTHESLRGLPGGSFDRIISAIKLLKKENFLDHLQVTFTANKKNLYELPELYNLLSAIGIDSLRTSFIDPIGRALEHPELLLSKEEMRWLFSFVNKANEKRGLPIVWGCCHFLKDEIKGRDFVCPTGKTIASVLANGDIFVCPNVPRRPELIQGNIKKDRFSEVWETGFKYFREERRPDFCSGCRYERRCRGDSLHTWDFKENRPFFCYKECFDTKTVRYESYLKEKYPGAFITIVESPGEDSDIFVEPGAYLDIRQYFHMGQNHPASVYEQQMGLVGFKTDDNYVIKYVFPSHIDRLGKNKARFREDTLSLALQETEIIKKCFEESDDKEDYVGDGLRFLGFCHSHPIQKELCYSKGDCVIHKEIANRFGDYIGILINPKEDLIGAYYGKEIRQGNLKLIEISPT